MATKARKWFASIIFVSTFFVSCFIPFYLSKDKSVQVYENIILQRISYSALNNELTANSLINDENNSSVSIDGNIDFINQAKNNNWPGNGTINAPFSIEDLILLNKATGIEIRNTDLYFSISNCKINSSKEKAIGISIQNSSNGLILDNRINFCDTGILLNNTFSINITRNYLENGNLAVYCLNSNFNDFTKNTISEYTFEGIILYNCNNANIIDNSITQCYLGINLEYCDVSVLSYNKLFSNREGIKIYVGDNFLVGRNIATDGNVGLSLSKVNNTLIINNTIKNNDYYGLYLHRSSNITVYWNSFIQNNAFTGTSQANDDTWDTQGNSFYFNYWDEWTTPDKDADGVVDIPYAIDGNSNNFDSFPLVYNTENYNSRLTLPDRDFLPTFHINIMFFVFVGIFLSFFFKIIQKNRGNINEE
ncbi:MAG: nitrous oxide reductase family maturation protein NosD [Candidatus Hodarchaeota archaeon]